MKSNSASLILRSQQSLNHDADANQYLLNGNSLSSSHLETFYWHDDSQTLSPSKHLNDDSSRIFNNTPMDFSLNEQEGTGLDDMESSLLETLQATLSESFLNDQILVSDGINTSSSSSSLQIPNHPRSFSPSSRLVPSKLLEMLNSNLESLVLDEINQFKYQLNQIAESNNFNNLESVVVS